MEFYSVKDAPFVVDGLYWFNENKEFVRIKAEDRDACTVDGCHPNDLGFYRMGKAICPIVEKALKNSNIL